MQQQGRWLKWEAARNRVMKWSEIWQMEGYRLSFILRAVYDVLPSPSNLCRWGLRSDPGCTLCGGPVANLEHVLSSCQSALRDGRYTWRHDQVLRILAEELENKRREKRKAKGGPVFMTFVRAGEAGTRKEEAAGVLAMATDWEMVCDVQGRCTFPREIVVTSLRPDITIWSRQSRTVVLVELTVPWEERMEEAHERKNIKYQQLVEECQEKGWRVWCLPVEVGCRGFVSQSVWRALRVLGVIGKHRRKLIGQLSKGAESASCWIWRKREEKWQREG